MSVPLSLPFVFQYKFIELYTLHLAVSKSTKALNWAIEIRFAACWYITIKETLNIFCVGYMLQTTGNLSPKHEIPISGCIFFNLFFLHKNNKLIKEPRRRRTVTWNAYSFYCSLCLASVSGLLFYGSQVMLKEKRIYVAMICGHRKLWLLLQKKVFQCQIFHAQMIFICDQSSLPIVNAVMLIN